MLKNVFLWILHKVFKIDTETKQTEVDDNQKYSFEYERIDDINFSAIFSNKLANYVIADSSMNIDGNNAKTGQSMWKKGKKITSMAFGYGGVFIVPYVKNNKIFYNIVPQGRVTIDSTEGDLITGATILAERKEISKGFGQTKTYIRWTNYRLERVDDENRNCIIEQKFSDETGEEIPAPSFWQNILLKQTISNVDRALLCYIKSPINNRKTNDKYGVPITYGCDNTISEIKETMKQLYDEYNLKRPFVGVDVTMFNGKNQLPMDGLFKKIDFGTDGESRFEVFDPQFRDYTDRLQELYKRLEHEIGTSAGIVSELNTENATATEIRRAMYDTFTIVDDMRSNLEKAMDDFFYACNVLANAYNLSPQGDYELGFNWSYSLLEDTDSEFNHLTIGYDKNVISKAELRNWIKPDEDMEQSEQAVKEIKENNPSLDDLLGTRGGDE